jgi:hypothetical protein
MDGIVEAVAVGTVGVVGEWISQTITGLQWARSSVGRVDPCSPGT